MLVLGPYAGLPGASSWLDHSTSGHVTYTEASDSASISAGVSVHAGVSGIEAPDTLGATASLPIRSNSVIVDGLDVLTTSTNLYIVANGLQTDAIDTVNSLGRVHVLAASTTIEANDSLSSLGVKTPIGASLSVVEGPDSGSSIGIHGKLSATTGLVITSQAAISAKGAMSGTTGTTFSAVGSGKSRVYGSGTTGITLGATGSGLSKGLIKGSTGVTFNSSASLRGKGALSGSIANSFGLDIGNVKLKTGGSTSFTVTVSGSMEDLILPPVLEDLPATTNPRLMLIKSIPDYRFYWIKTTNPVTRMDSVYAAFINTSTGDWDRKHVLTGYEEIPTAIQFDAEFVNGKVFGSVQLTNVFVTPQPLQNQTYLFDFDGSALSSEFLRAFTRRLPTLIDEYWDDPCPHFADDGSQYFSIWRTIETQRYEIYRKDPLEWIQLDKTLNGEPFYVSQFTSLNWVGSQLVLVGNNGNIYYSSNGYEWTM